MRIARLRFSSTARYVIAMFALGACGRGATEPAAATSNIFGPDNRELVRVFQVKTGLLRSGN